MANYKSALTTHAGLKMVHEAANGKLSFTITKVEASGDELSDKNDEVLQSMTKINNTVQKGKIIEEHSIKNSQRLFKVRFSNTELRSPYTINTIGVYATREDTGQEQLFAIICAGTGKGQYMPALDEIVAMTFDVTAMIEVGNNANVTINMSAEDSIDQSDLDRTKNELEVQWSKRYEIQDDKITVLKEKINEVDNKELLVIVKNEDIAKEKSSKDNLVYGTFEDL